jgi:ferric-dicitrate binding protein FerR (iron transport regulator)
MNRNNDRHIDFDKVARYLSGEMNAAEIAEFELEMKQNPELAKEVDQSQSIWGAATQSSFDADAAWSKLDSKIRATEKQESSFGLKWVLRIAAVLIVAVGLFWMNYSPNHEEVTGYATGNETFEDHLADGSVMLVNAGSTIEYSPSFNKETRTINLKGEAFFKVAKNPEKPFIVQTPNGKVTVLGTQFNVKTDEKGNLNVAVQEGKVQVESTSGKKVILTKGESAAFNSISNELIKKDESFDLFWVNKTLKFRETELRKVFEIVEGSYNTSINVSEKAMVNCPYTATFKDAPLDTVMHIINMANEKLMITKTDTSYEVSGNCN